MAEAFFRITKDSLDRITQLCDLMHPITVSMWHLRSKVTDLYSQFPEASNANLDHFFAEGSAIAGTNYKNAFINTTWEQHEESIAWIFLSNIFAIYEGWLKGLHEEVFDDTHGDLNEKVMQFPEPKLKSDGTIRENGIIEELARLTVGECVIVKDLFFNSYASKRHRCFVRNSANELELNASMLKNLLYCYRFFKELRNCYTHNAQIADAKTVAAYDAFKNHVLTPDDLDMDCIPAHITPVEGTKISVDRYGVIGFSQVVQKIMTTIDAVLLCSDFAEDKITEEMVSRVRRLFKPEQNCILLTNIYNKRLFENKIVGILMEAGYARTELRKKNGPDMFDETGLNYILQIFQGNNLIKMQNCRF